MKKMMAMLISAALLASSLTMAVCADEAEVLATETVEATETAQEEASENLENTEVSESSVESDTETDDESDESVESGDEAERETVTEKVNDTESEADSESEAGSECEAEEVSESETETETELLELEAYTGTCGTNTTWKLDNEGMLWINGSGTVSTANWLSYSSKIEMVVIGDDITKLPGGAFKNCTNLTEIISDRSGDLTQIPASCCYGCTKLVRVSFSDNVSYIGEAAFFGCTSLYDFLVPYSVTAIGDSAFNGCTSLYQVMFDNMYKCTTIGQSVFKNCSSLEVIDFPDALQYLGMYCFQYCNSLKDISFAQTKLTGVPMECFADCENLFSVQLPDTCAYIGNSAFAHDQKLESLAFGSGLTNVYDDAFVGCIAVNLISVPDLTSWLNIKFANAEANPNFYTEKLTLYVGGVVLKKLSIPSGIVTIRDYAFQGVKSISSISFAGSVKVIGKKAFAFCDGLTKLTIGDSVVKISDAAFYGCRNLLSVKNARSILQVGAAAFMNCVKLKTAPFLFSCSSIGEMAFASTALTDVVITRSDTNIGNAAFDQDVTIHAYMGSTAKDYALNNGNDFHEVSTSAVLNVFGFVERLYSVCLGRKADQIGKDDWAFNLISGRNTGVQAAYGFIFSPEFTGKNYCNECYIKYLYKAIMGRTYDSAGLKSWLKKFSEGYSREYIFNGFAQSGEFSNICSNYGIIRGSGIAMPAGYGTLAKGKCKNCGAEDGVSAFIKRLYQVCLNRSATASEVSGWANKVWNNGMTGSKLAYGFFWSKEFLSKNYSNTEFVERCYRVFLGREPDKTGLISWVDKLDAGADRIEVFNGFVGSGEFKMICNRAGFAPY